MYVEERLATLENITNQHGKQIEMVAEGLASLTSRVNLGFTEMREQFQKVDQRFERLEERVGRVEVKLDEHDARFDSVEAKLADHDARFDRVEAKLADHDARFDRIDQQFLQVHGVLAEIVTLVKSKL